MICDKIWINSFKPKKFCPAPHGVNEIKTNKGSREFTILPIKGKNLNFPRVNLRYADGGIDKMAFNRQKWHIFKY